MSHVPLSSFSYETVKIERGILTDEGFGLPGRVLEARHVGAHYPKDTRAVIVGWGKTQGAVYPERLSHADVVTEDWETCNYKFRHAEDTCVSNTERPFYDIPKKVICTQGQSSRAPGSCHGDSGSPVLIDDVIAGLVRSAISKNDVCIVGAPSLHTNVADYVPWIYSFTEPGRDTSQIPGADEPA